MTRAPERALPGVLAQPARRVDARLEELLGEEIERWAAVDAELRHPLTTGILLLVVRRPGRGA